MCVHRKHRKLCIPASTDLEARLGIPICKSGRIAWPLLGLAGGGVAIAIAISFSDIWGRSIAFLKQQGKVHAPKIDVDGTIEDSDCGTEEDRISQLPNDLLSDILSRLDLIDAARTSILSRRWRNIFTLRSRLILNCLGMLEKTFLHDRDYLAHGKRRVLRAKRKEKHRFLKAVDQILMLYSGRTLTYFKMSCCFGEEFGSNLERWMHILASLGVEELDLQFSCHYFIVDVHFNRPLQYFAFPFQLLFEVASLKCLHLTACVLQPSFKGQFNSLVELHLFCVPLDNGELPSIFSSCLNLQCLAMAYCRLPDELCISSSGLVFWRIHCCPSLRVIDLKAINLLVFDCYSYYNIRVKLSCAPRLIKLYVSVNGRDTFPYMFGEVSKDCSQLKSLTFQTRTDEVKYITLRKNLFSELRHLNLFMVIDSQADLLNITPILGACPLLERFHLLAKCPTHNGQRGEERWPTMRHTCLKEVKFNGFHGTRNQIELASYIVRSAPALQLLILDSLCHRYVSYGKWSSYYDGIKLDKQKGELIKKELRRQAHARSLNVVIQ